MCLEHITRGPGSVRGIGKSLGGVIAKKKIRVWNSDLRASQRADAMSSL